MVIHPRTAAKEIIARTLNHDPQLCARKQIKHIVGFEAQLGALENLAVGGIIGRQSTIQTPAQSLPSLPAANLLRVIPLATRCRASTIAPAASARYSKTLYEFRESP